MGLNTSKNGFKVLFREFLHLPLGRATELEEVTENFRVGTDAVVGPLGGARLAGRFPLP